MTETEKEMKDTKDNTLCKYCVRVESIDGKTKFTDTMFETIDKAVEFCKSTEKLGLHFALYNIA